MTYAGTEQAKSNGPAFDEKVKPALRRVGIVLFEGFSLLSAGIVAEVFQLANEISAAGQGEHASYRVQLLSAGGGSVTCSSSVQVWTEGLEVRASGAFEALFIASGVALSQTTLEERLVGWLHAVTPAGGAAQDEASGAGGAASGYRTTQHATNRTTAVFDVAASQSDDRFESMKSALMLVKRDLGLDIAREIGERLMPGSGARLLPLLGGMSTTVAEKIRRSAQWLRENCDRPISVADAAQEAAMSERNYLRRFKLEMGSTPSDYLLQARLDMTCRLLTGTELPVDKIARRSGMGNGDHLARIFRKRWSMSPTEYRLRNRREREVLVEFTPPPVAVAMQAGDCVV